MWLDRVDVTPKTISERIKEWESNDTCHLLFQSVRKMADEDGVKVFYLRGNHDHEINAQTVKTLMGGNVEFIEGSLVYIIKSDDGQTYRIRFAHGHDWDIFNTYSLSHPNDPLGGRPIGYYLTRAVATADAHKSETEMVCNVKQAKNNSLAQCYKTRQNQSDHSIWPIIIDANNAMNQPELEYM